MLGSGQMGAAHSLKGISDVLILIVKRELPSSDKYIRENKTPGKVKINSVSDAARWYKQDIIPIESVSGAVMHISTSPTIYVNCRKWWISWQPLIKCYELSAREIERRDSRGRPNVSEPQWSLWINLGKGEKKLQSVQFQSKIVIYRQN